MNAKDMMASDSTDETEERDGAEYADDAAEDEENEENEDMFDPDPAPRVIRTWHDDVRCMAGAYESTQLLDCPQDGEIILRTTCFRGAIRHTTDIVADAERLRAFRGWATPSILRSAVISRPMRIVWAEDILRMGWPIQRRGERQVLARWTIREKPDAWGGRLMWDVETFASAPHADGPPCHWVPGVYELARRGPVYEIAVTRQHKTTETTRLVKEMQAVDVHDPETLDVFRIPDDDLRCIAQEVEMMGRMVYWRRDYHPREEA